MKNPFTSLSDRLRNNEKRFNIIGKFLFFLVGIASVTWFLIRVIPKPQRATYPCMRTAFPLASSFILYIVSITSSAFFFKKFYKKLMHGKFVYALTFFLIAALIVSFTIFSGNNTEATARTIKLAAKANVPQGIPVGIFQGRVVWVHSPLATNESCIPDSPTSPWWSASNNDQNKIDSMLTLAIQDITGAETDESAWDSIFMFHNNTRGKGKVTYVSGEKVFIKTNATSTWTQNIDLATMEQITTSDYYGMSETSPQVVLAVLRQLVNVAGVNESDIYVGDPMKHLYQSHYTLWHSEFPDVHYIDNSETFDGRELAVDNNDPNMVIDYSGTTITQIDNLFTIYEDMEYMLNIPTMKGHKHAGVTMFAKNHFGSQTRTSFGGHSASHLHKGLVKTDATLSAPDRTGYGLYRVQVDIMGHKLLGKKNLLYIMDALYTAGMELDHPIKWQMSPFNNDWSSSIFVSFDPIAIESVGYDFLSAEFDGASDCPQMSGTDDYLRQAASSANWPAGLTYDPENDGSAIGSLGVYEHWNSTELKQYSGNLGTGNGIELVYINADVYVPPVDAIPAYTLNGNKIFTVSPNPFKDEINVSFNLKGQSDVTLTLFDMQGRVINTITKHQLTGENMLNLNSNDLNIKSGSSQYILKLKIDSRYGSTSQSILINHQ